MNPHSQKIRLVAALNSFDTMRDGIGDLMVKAFPVGSTVQYTHGDYNRTATVLDHQKLWHSLRVEGVTGTKYWIDLRRLIP